MTAGHDTRAAAQAECDRANAAPFRGITLAPRRCGACNGVGHTSRSKACPSHPETRCLDCNEQRQHHRDRGHRFRSEPLIGDLAPAVKP